MRIINAVLSVSSLFFSITSLPAQNLNKHVINPQDVLTIRELYDVNLSPDGKQIAFVVNDPHDPSKPREPRASNVWVVSTNGQELPIPLIAGLNHADTPRWSPDGKTLAFLSDRGDAEAQADNSAQVYLLRAGERKAVRVSNVRGGIEEYHWSPDGKMIAFVAGDQMTPEEQVRRDAGDDAIVQPETDLKYSRLWIVRLEDGKATQVTKQNFEILEFAWSPAGDEFALTVAPSSRSEDSNNLSLVIINRSTGEVSRTLSRNVTSITGLLKWSPDGRWLTFYEFPPTKESNNWLSIAPARGGERKRQIRSRHGGQALRPTPHRRQEGRVTREIASKEQHRARRDDLFFPDRARFRRAEGLSMSRA